MLYFSQPLYLLDIETLIHILFWSEKFLQA